MSELQIRVMATMMIKSRGRWDEDRCWYILRQELPAASDNVLQLHADVIQAATD